MLWALDVAGIMPSKKLLALDHCSHSLDPVRMVNCFQSSVLSFLDCWVSGIVALLSVTEKAGRALYL